MCILAILSVVCVIILYFYSVRNHNYWKNRNVAYIKPAPLWVSDFYKIFKKPILTTTESATLIYKMFPNEKLVGFFKGGNPGMLVRDPEFIKHIFILDFDHFHKRTVYADENDPMFTNLFHASGDQWRLLRQRLTSAFTIVKLQKMFPHVVKCAKRLQILGDKIINNGGIVDAHEIMSRFTMEFICNCGLGIDLDILLDENSSFYKFTKETFIRTTWEIIVILLGDIIPLPKWVRVLYFLNEKSKLIIKDIVSKVCENRNYKPSECHDFIDLLLGIGAMGKIKPKENKNQDGLPVEVEIDLSDPNLIAAQAYVFFSAGFETAATSTSFTLHQLAFHPEIQREIQEEIDKILTKYNGELCYEAVSEMTLLEMAFYESMRIFPPAGIINRTCTKEYTFPGTNITIDPGVTVVIPASAIHNDEKYFPDPHEFKPERFKPEVVKERNKNVFMPFGIGKRTCIGSRLGQMQSMAGLAALLQCFNIEPAPQSRRDVKVDCCCRIVQGIKGGLPIKFVKRARN